MLYVQITALGFLLFSDILLVISLMKYTVSHGDPKAVEQVKIQIIFGFIGSIISTFILFGVHLIEGIHAHTYTTLEWFCIYTVLCSLCVLLCSFIIYHVLQYMDVKRKNKFFWVNVIPFLELLLGLGVLFFVLCSQLFVVLVTIKSFI